MENIFKKSFVIGVLIALEIMPASAQSNPSNDFAIKFFEKVIEARKDSSVITSPLGVSFVLGMLANGAHGQTAQEINTALGWSDAAALADHHHQLMETLPSLDERTELSIANAIILNSAKGFSMLPSYTEQMEGKYEALVKSLDFSETSTLDYINNWGAEQTKGVFTKVLKQLNPSLVSLLMNALYFKGIWSKTFNPDLTTKKHFFTAERTNEEIAMMHDNGAYPYAANDLFKTVRLDYGNGSYSMYVLLPENDHSIAEVLAEMKTTDWMNAPVMTNDVNIALPQFTSESDLDMEEILQTLGITSMFKAGSADFSGMINISDIDEKIYVSMFKQVARIEIDENGTKAAAITQAGESATSRPNNYFCADHPFLYAIVENNTSTICFIGQFTGVGPDATARPVAAGIHKVEQELQTTNEIYDYSGRKLRQTNPKGFYIVNGKKFVK